MKRYILLFALLLSFSLIAQSALAQVRRAERALRRANFEEALSFANSALEKDSEDANAYDVRARIHRAQARAVGGGQYLEHVSAMVKDFTQVMTLNPKTADKIMLQLQEFWIEEFNRGIEEFNNGQAEGLSEEQAYAHYNSSALRFEACAMALPDSANSYVNWAFALLRANDEIGAIHPLTMALDYGSGDTQIYSLLGRIYLTNERVDEAIDVLEKGVMDFPDDEGLQSLLLTAFSSSDNAERALDMYGSMVLQAPDNKMYRYNYGSLLLQAEQFDQAIEQLTAAIALDNSYVDAHYNLGAAFINKANVVQSRINAMDDSLRAHRDSISPEDQEAQTAKIDELIALRVSLYEQAISPLEEAKRLGDADEAHDPQAICVALYQAYVQTDQMAKVESVTACANL